MVKAVTRQAVIAAIRENHKDADQITEETGLCKTSVYNVIRTLRDEGRIDLKADGPRTLVKYREPTTTPTTPTPTQQPDRPDPDNQGATPSHVHVNGHGIKVVDYNPDDLLLNKEAILERYKNRSFCGVKDFDLLGNALEEHKNVLFRGPKGCGKSAAARAFAAFRGLPYFRINLDGMVTAEDLIGQWVRAGDDWAWSDGILTTCMRYGGLLVIDEINAGSPEVNFVFQSALDDDRQIVLRNKDNEVVRAHPNFLVVANMNPDYEGTHPLNEALEDRFDLIIDVDYDNRVESLIISDARLRDFARRVRKMYEEKEISRPVSTRALLQYEANREQLGEEIALQSLVAKFEAEDRDAIREAAIQVLTEQKDEEIVVEDQEQGGA